MVCVPVCGGAVQARSLLRHQDLLLVVAAAAAVEPVADAGLELVEVGRHAEVLRQLHVLHGLGPGHRAVDGEVAGHLGLVDDVGRLRLRRPASGGVVEDGEVGVREGAGILQIVR